MKEIYQPCFYTNWSHHSRQRHHSTPLRQDEGKLKKKKDHHQVHYRQNEQRIPAGLIISPRHEMHFNSDSDSRCCYIITQHVDCGHVEGHRGHSFWIQRYDTAASKWTRELISLRYYSSNEGINERPGIRALQDYFRSCVLLSHRPQLKTRWTQNNRGFSWY